MLSRLIARSVIQCKFSHSFYAQHVIESPINTAEETYANNRKMMNEVNGTYLNILKKVFKTFNVGHITK